MREASYLHSEPDANDADRHVAAKTFPYEPQRDSVWAENRALTNRVHELETALREIRDMRGTPEARTGRWHEVARAVLGEKS